MAKFSILIILSTATGLIQQYQGKKCFAPVATVFTGTCQNITLYVHYLRSDEDVC